MYKIILQDVYRLRNLLTERQFVALIRKATVVDPLHGTHLLRSIPTEQQELNTGLII